MQKNFTTQIYEVHIYSASDNDISEVLKNILIEKAKAVVENQTNGGVSKSYGTEK